ncbi:MAG: 50S ribosomal protein L21 [Cyanobium sp.]|jgi:large subunit ribosomal protein L21|nr:50S ribosomal protein L21 [Synechococcaceae cyanobacterium]
MPDPTSASAPSPSAAPVNPAPAGGGAGTYAIVEASGQQFWLQPDRYVDIDRIDATEGDTITLDSVLLVHDASGTSVGQPYVPGASVQLQVLAHRRGPKVIVYKMRPKKKTRRKNGHRQELTRVKVTSITVAASVSA